ncbi:MAG: hypothetical protein GY805_30040 [Chloroflexi bacterium]|nr:hypothetical protein [Chloroflexota bacterium]
MKSIYVKLIFVICLATLLLAQLNVTAVYACTPTPEGKPPPTVADRVRSADVVLVGTVVMVEKTAFPYTATVDVGRYLKSGAAGGASMPDQIDIAGFGGGDICARHVEVGELLVFYVKQYADGSFHADWLTAGSAAVAPNKSLVLEITTAMGIPPDMDIAHPPPTQITYTPLPPTASIISSTPVITDTPLPETAVSTTIPPTKTTSNLALAGIGILLLLILITAVIWHRR